MPYPPPLSLSLSLSLSLFLSVSPPLYLSISIYLSVYIHQISKKIFVKYNSPLSSLLSFPLRPHYISLTTSTISISSRPITPSLTCCSCPRDAPITCRFCSGAHYAQGTDLSRTPSLEYNIMQSDSIMTIFFPRMGHWGDQLQTTLTKSRTFKI